MEENGPNAVSVKLAGNAAIAVGIGATVYTDVLPLFDLDTFSLFYKVTCTGVPSVKIELEEGIVKPTGNEADGNYVTPEGVAPIEEALGNKVLHCKALFPVCAPYGRLKITELTGTVTDTVMTINFVRQRKTLM